MSPPTMELRDAVAVIRDARAPGDIVIPSMGSAREWMALGDMHDLDFVLVPSAMGHATSLGLGIALAQPERRVIVLSGDGSLLMNLGTLVTISAQAPANLVVVVFVNGVYEVTGAQATPADVVANSTSGAVAYEFLARASGITSVFHWSTIDEWRNGVRAALDVRGPAVVILDVAPVPDAVGPRSPGPTRARAARFMRALNAEPGDSV